jgi:hypothetical protein
MSWSYSRTAKPKELMDHANHEFTQWKCVEPEQTARMSCLSILQNLLVSWPADTEVKVEMYGSQATPDASKPSEHTQSLSVKIGLADA